MHVIIGLGNPEDSYAGTRHNIGFEALNYFSQVENIDIRKIKHRALIGEGFIENKKVMLVKPQTYMNLSGESILDIVDYYDVPLENILVIYDDVDLEVGRLRIRSKGSAGTHNGMKSIIYQLKDDNIPRLRIGIGRPERQDMSSFVLSKFSKEEKEDIINVIKKTEQAIRVFISQGITEAMNQFNREQDTGNREQGTERP